MSCSLSSIHSLVSVSCILVLHLLCVIDMCLLDPQLISISTIHLSSLFYILCPIHYLLFMYLSSIQSSISSHLYMFLSSLSGLFCPHFQVFYSICSSILLSNSLQFLSQVHRGEYSNNPSAEIFNTCQCQLSTLHFMSLLVYNSLTFHIQSIVTTLSSKMI